MREVEVEPAPSPTHSVACSYLKAKGKILDLKFGKQLTGT